MQEQGSPVAALCPGQVCPHRLPVPLPPREAPWPPCAPARCAPTGCPCCSHPEKPARVAAAPSSRWPRKQALGLWDPPSPPYNSHPCPGVRAHPSYPGYFLIAHTCQGVQSSFCSNIHPHLTESKGGPGFMEGEPSFKKYQDL